ncbi:HAD family hydrolase [Salinimonas sp. HHU 13199]|uniref:D,D-heptose 1,7-bisphosphate phosphatase n=1 Tax=Salinimonas profundi TaxID=2729140 RepID=A0ABR8LE33_9ALTE|nr:HAD family hydrolase [Salinimonas profundi]MBD3584552.1 HAD family hydrolase [Salinimonas profundi]
MNQHDKQTRLLFLDRDGIINEDKGYVGNKSAFCFIPGIFDVVGAFVEHGFLPVVVTNQSGIGRGFYTESDFHALTHWMREAFAEKGMPFIPVYYCPHHPTEAKPPYKKQCNCRKPSPGMLLSAANDLGADLSKSVLLGDSWRDIQAGAAAGLASQCYVSKQPQPTPALSNASVFQADTVAQVVTLVPQIIAATKTG